MVAKQSIQLSKLRLDGGTQPRVKIDTGIVSDYTERMTAGDDFPPVDAFFDGVDHWLADGFHRYHAAAAKGAKAIAVTIRKGTRRDAVLFSCAANGSHGLPRSSADKRRAVEILLADDEWGKKSSRWIADTACVSHSLVNDVRAQLEESSSSNEKTARTGKDGKLRETPAAKLATFDRGQLEANRGQQRPKQGTTAPPPTPAKTAAGMKRMGMGTAWGVTNRGLKRRRRPRRPRATSQNCRQAFLRTCSTRWSDSRW